jgi:putative ABC transport system permease protein
MGEINSAGAVPIGPGGGFTTQFPTMNVKGYTNPEQLDDFREDYRGITSGSFPANNNECIISEDFAALNNIEVGDIIDLAQGMVENNPLSLKVVGIYFDLTKNQFGGTTDAPAAINVRNDIITNYETASAFAKSDPRVDTAAYFLKSPDLIAKFESEARAAGLSYDYKVTIDEDAYNRVVKPVEGMAKVSLTFMIVVLILGGLIIVLLASLAIRERKYEIGVLRAMGMKKHKVALGLVCESLAIMVVCLTIGLGIGTVAAQPVSDILLQGQVAAIESNTNSGTGASSMYAGVQTNANAQPLTKLNVNLNINVVMTIILISLLLVLVSSVAGIIKITKYEPIKILTERN